MPNIKLSVSLVIYNSNPVQTRKAIESVLKIKTSTKFDIVDNSPQSHFNVKKEQSQVTYHKSPNNPGFGTSHNKIFKKIFGKSEYHLIVNPDVYFEEGVIEDILGYMDANPEVGVVMPKVLYPDRRHQYLAKLLPTPFDFVVRRFMPVAKVQSFLNKNFELRGWNMNKALDVPFLSGCCLVFRTSVLREVEGFDENIFMYTEDIDICRRIIDAGYRSVFYPKVFVYHDHVRKSFRDFSVFLVYLKSGIYYFNKWGWLFDARRHTLNKETLKQLSSER
ncbi:glycosyltransferase family 2 protein [Desertivirga xinjiangensis]|uniref:glycosyltransferase family 2 protein n=1 Tax=Desertivirga xinjiangensis TaxID=539206 RepID=UPI00210D5178|nr:glycosyltransferase family 2 protein [Pedobacter xinjiangensis]